MNFFFKRNTNSLTQQLKMLAKKIKEEEKGFDIKGKYPILPIIFPSTRL